jgi:CheY-like chemotaxis protein
MHSISFARRRLISWEVARRLKSDEQTKRIPIIALSGRSMQHEQVSALRAGCDVYLTKPCSPDRLLTAIRKLLGMTPPSSDRRAEPGDPY